MADGLSGSLRSARAAVVVTWLGALSTAGACSEDAKRPPPLPLTGRAVENPIACKELQNAAAGDAALLLDGGEANCAANGQVCPLLSATFAAACDASLQSIGQCGANKWRFACRTVGDAGGGASD